MLEVFNNLSPYAPFAIYIASFLDILFATGLILYGAATMSSVAVMYATGMISFDIIILSAYSGTMSGSIVNYFIGQYFSEKTFVSKRLDSSRLDKARAFLDNRGLFLFILVSRFVTFTRPLYSILLGSLKIKFHRFIFYESIIALFWIIFWLLIIVKGTEIYLWFFGTK